MGISTFGGVPADSSGGAGVTDPMVVGQVVQAAGGVNMLPADGRVLNRDDYPVAYTALQDEAIQGNTLVANSSYGAMDYQNSPIPGAAIASKNTLVQYSSAAVPGMVNVSQDNGITWQNVPLPLDPQTGNVLPWKFLTANDSIFCIICDRYSAISGDGLNWTLSDAISLTLDLGVITWTGTKFIWFGTHLSGGNVYLSSIDGLNWTNSNAIPLGLVNRIFALNDGSLFAYGNTDAKNVATNKAAISRDGVNWSVVTLPSAETFYGGAYNSGTNTICLVAGNKVLTSTDSGGTWTSTLYSAMSNTPFTSISSVGSFVATDNTFVLHVVTATGVYKYGMFKSTDGINWTQIANFGALAYANNLIMPMLASDGVGTFVVVNQGIMTVSRDEGVTWIAVQPFPDAAAPNSVIWTGTQFVCFNNSSSNSYKSTDGINWTLASTTVPLLPGPASLYSYNATLGVHFLTVGNINTITCGVCLTSPDGITWTSRALPGTIGLHSISSSGGKTIITNNSGANVYLTTNGTSFVAQTAAGTGSWIAAASPTQFVRVPLPAGALTSGSTYYTSPDGVTWTSRTLPIPPGMAAGFTGWSPSAIFWTGTQFVIISGSGSSSTIYCAIATSPDGITWTFVNQPFGTAGTQGVSYVGVSYTHYPVAYGNNGLAVILRAYTGAEINLAVTHDGTNWNPLRMTPRSGSLNLAGLSLNGGGNEVFGLSGPYVIRYKDSTGKVDIQMTSTNYNGRTGTNIKIGSTYYSFAFTQASPNNVTSYPALRSDDFANWTQFTVTSSNVAQISYLNGKMIALNLSGQCITSSDGGVTWTRTNGAYVGTNLTNRLVSFLGNKILMNVAPATPGSTVVSTYTYPSVFDDASNSFPSRIPFFSLAAYNSTIPFAKMMARKGNKVIMGHALDGVLSTSSDGGETWLPIFIGPAPCAIAYNAERDLFVMIPYNLAPNSGNYNNSAAHTVAYSSKDGYKWIARTMPSSQKWTGVRAFNSLFFAVAGSSAVWAYSMDGINWTQIAAPTSADWMYINGTDKNLTITLAAGSLTYAQINRQYDTETQFQLPVYTVAAGQPGWFIKVK